MTLDSTVSSDGGLPLTRWRLHISMILVAGVSLVVQLAYLAETKNDLTFEVPIVDAGVYHEAAVRFSRGEALADDAFWQPPLFPLLLGCLYRVAGPSVLIARVVLAGVAMLSCVLVWWIGRRVFSNGVGVVTGLMVGVYGPFVFFSTRLLPTGLAVFLDLVALSLWICCIERSRWYRWLLFGLAVGAATITVANSGVLLIIALIGVSVSPLVKAGDRRLGAAVIASVVMVLGAAVPVGAVTIRNHLVSGEWVLISTNGGINFFIGNNPRSDETVAVRPGEPWRRLARQSYGAGARTRAEQSTYFFRQGLAYLADQPLNFLRGIASKTLRLINAREIPRNVDPYVYRDFSHLLAILMWRAGTFAFPFGLLVPLAVVGVVASLRSSAATGGQRTGRFALLAFIVAYGASIVLFFVSSRYRLPVAVVMTLFAAAGVVWIWGQLRSPDRHRTPRRVLFAAGGAFIAAAVAVNLPIRAPTDGVNFRAEMFMCVGHGHAAAGRLNEAQEHLRHALLLDPYYAAAAAGLSDVLILAGNLDEAEVLLREAITWQDESAETRRLLGQLLHTRGRLDEAVHAFEETLAIDPTSPEAHAGIADTLVSDGRIDLAIEHYRKAVDLAEKPGPLLIRLGDALVQSGEYEEAIDRYRQGLWRIEPEPATLNRVAWLLATCPVVELRDCKRAIEIAEHLCRITDYEHPVAMDTLAAAYAECGRWADAVTWVRRAIDTALANNDTETADSFGRRLHIYEQRLAERVQDRSDPPPTSSSDKP